MGGWSGSNFPLLKSKSKCVHVGKHAGIGCFGEWLEAEGAGKWVCLHLLLSRLYFLKKGSMAKGAGVRVLKNEEEITPLLPLTM